MLRPTVCRPVRPGAKHSSGANDQTFTTVRQSRARRFGAPPPPRREDGSATHNRCRSSPVQSISGPSPAEPATTLHRLRFETSSFVAFHDSQDHGGGPQPRLHMRLIIFIIFFYVMGPARDIITCLGIRPTYIYAAWTTHRKHSSSVVAYGSVGFPM
jgi:hypothetical protein